VALTYDNATFKFYVNGQPVNSTVIKKSRTLSDLPLIMGRRGDGGYFLNGALDNVRVFNRALSDSEITALAIPGGNG
jgi:hypothetical protein